MSVRWGILGCGDVCEVKSGPGFQLARDSELVAVMRRDRAKAEDFARRHGVPAFYDDADALLADARVDAVYVASPPGSHLELALKVAAAGKPCYVEKPMARSHRECLHMLEAFERAGQPLFVAYYRRALDRFMKAKDLLVGGRLGTLERVEVRFENSGQLGLDAARLPWRVQAEHAGAGLFLDLASHTLDVLDFLLGPLCNVTGEARNAAFSGDVEDRVSLRFETQSGVTGVGHWNFTSEQKLDRIELYGDRGRLRLTTFGNDPVVLESSAGNEEHFDLPNPKHIQLPFIQTMVDALLGRGTCASTGVSAARTSAVMDSALRGYYGSREGEFWRQPERWPGRRSPG